MDTIEELSRLLTPISDARLSLGEVSNQFKARGYIRPIQCKWAIDQLEELEGHVQKICNFLDQTDHLPLVYRALRYWPLLRLGRIQELISTLIYNIENHLVSCMRPSEQLLRLRNEIQEGFETLSQYISEMPQQLQFLDDEARFQERRLNAVLAN
jgi:hypothetical protein